MLSTFQLYLMSSAVAINIKHGAMTMTKTHRTARLLFIVHTNCIATANPYPNGFRTSNGNLHTKNLFEVKKESFNSVPKFKKAYHIDVRGSSKASAPKSLVK